MRLVRLNWKILRLVIGAAVLSLGAGCSGINMSKSVSPATFLLPGLMQADPLPGQAEPGLSPPGPQEVALSS
jgi:hypothetical protein